MEANRIGQRHRRHVGQLVDQHDDEEGPERLSGRRARTSPRRRSRCRTASSFSVDSRRSAIWPPKYKPNTHAIACVAKIHPICAAGEPEHVAEIQRQQRQPRAPDQVLEEHHHGKSCRGGGHDSSCTIVHLHGRQAGRRVHRQRVHDPLSHSLVGSGSRRGHPRHLQSDARQRGRRRGAGAIAARRRCEGVRLDRVDGRRSSRSTASGSAVPTSRASRTWSASSPRSRTARSSRRSRARSRSAGTPPRRRAWWSSSRRPASCTATSRTSCLRRASSAASRSCGRAAQRWRAGPTWRGPPKSTAARTCRGSGRAICRAAAC